MAQLEKSDATESSLLGICMSDMERVTHSCMGRVRKGEASSRVEGPSRFDGLRFGERLQAMIKRRGMLQREFAQQLGLETVDQTHVSRWITRDTVPTDPTLHRMAETLDVTYFYLRYGIGTETASEEWKAFCRQYKEELERVSPRLVEALLLVPLPENVAPTRDTYAQLFLVLKGLDWGAVDA